MSNSSVQKVLVEMAEPDWYKMLAYCRAAKPNEVIGLAHVEIINRRIVVSNPFILPQTVTGSTCEIEQRDLVKFVGKYDEIGKVKCVWHSHVEMSAFFSTCDRDTSQKLAALGTMMRGSESLFVSIVANVKGEYECRVDMFHPFMASLPGEVRVVAPQIDGVEDEVKDMVKKHEPTAYYGGGSSPSGGGAHQSSFPGFGGGTPRPDERWTDDDIFAEVQIPN